MGDVYAELCCTGTLLFKVWGVIKMFSLLRWRGWPWAFKFKCLIWEKSGALAYGYSLCSLLLLFTLFEVVICCWELSNPLDPPEDVPVDEVVEDDPPLEDEWEWGANDCSISWTVWFWMTCWMCCGLLLWCITEFWRFEAPPLPVGEEAASWWWIWVTPPLMFAVDAYSWWRVLSITESLPTTLDLGFLLFLEESEQQHVDPQQGTLRKTRRIRFRNWKMRRKIK